MSVRWPAYIPQAMQRHRGCVAPRPEDVLHEAEICGALHVTLVPQAEQRSDETALAEAPGR